MNVGVRELKAHLSSYLARVERGEEVTVTSRGREVARLLAPASRARPVWLERAGEEGWITPPPVSGSGQDALDALAALGAKPRPRDSVTGLLLAERDSYYGDGG